MLLTSILTFMVLLLTIIATVLVLYLKWHYRHWDRKKIPYLPYNFLAGHIKSALLRKESSIIIYKKMYDEMKARGHKHCGTYYLFRPIYFPFDPDIIKHILTKDFQHFVDRGFYVNEKVFPLTGNLLRLEGQKWRDMRQKLTPAFTSSKMKWMFNILVETSDSLCEVVNAITAKGEPFDVKEVASRYTTDVIGSCAFGIDINSMKNPDSEFRKYHERLFSFGMKRVIIGLFGLAAPRFLKLINARLITKDTEYFYRQFVRDMVEHREKNNIVRKDFLQMLIELKNKGKLSEEEVEQEYDNSEDKLGTNSGLTMDELTAQVFVFFVAGYETSATTIQFALYELADNHAIQETLRDEINNTLLRYDHKIAYEMMADMPYLDKVFKETVRKYPPSPHLNRECTKPYKLQSADLELKAGDAVIISVLAMHRDPEHYPDPDKFDPERFNKENTKNRDPYVYLPFGNGPRNCIGERFGVMQTKIALIALIKSFRFYTISSEKITFAKQGFLFKPSNKIMLRCVKID